MLHKILSFIDLAESEFFKKKVFDFFILNEGGEGEMVFEALEDKILVVDAFLLNNLKEILIDLIVIDCSESTYLAGLPFTLNGTKRTSSKMV